LAYEVALHPELQIRSSVVLLLIFIIEV
jgi:hypothetical protein